MCQFQQIVQQFFKDYGRLVAKWPLLFILSSSVVAVALTAGLLINFRTIVGGEGDDQFRLFLPENAESMKNLRRLRSLFPISARDAYDVFQSAYAYVIVVADGEGNVLREDVLSSVANIVQGVKAIRVKLGWIEASWTNLCARDVSGVCLEHPLITALNSTFLTDHTIKDVAPFLTYPTARFGSQLMDNSLLFGSVRVDEGGRMTRAAALRLPFLLQLGDSVERRRLNQLWQREFVRVVRAMRYKDLTMYVSSSYSWKDEMDRNGNLLVSYLPALFGVLLVFCVICCCTNDWIISQPWLGFCGLLSAILAVLSAFGVLFYFQYQYLQVVVIMPFLVLSVCADNAFLMLSAWQSSSGDSNLEHRMSSAISQSAVSILITALTDGLSFAVGSASQFPAVRIFCTYCAVAVLFTFLYQITFFAACLTLCGRRELAHRHCLTLTIVPKTASTSKRHRHGQSESISLKLSSLLASAMDMKVIKLLIVLSYGGYLASSIYGLANSQLHLNMSNLVPYDSYVIGERRASEAHFSDYYGYAQAVVMTDNQEYHQPSSLAQLIDLYERLCDTEFTSLGQFWLSEFMQHVDERSVANEEVFLEAVRHFLNDPAFSIFRDDLIWAPDGGISATRMFIRLRRVGGGNQSLAVKTLRRRFSESRLSGFITDPVVFLVADQNDAVLGCVLQDAAIATGVIMAVVIVFLPKLLCALWIGLSILSINVGVLGYLALWNVQVDVISMMTTVMSVGLSVDYVAHVTYHYLVAHNPSSYMRMRHALQHAGWASIQSAVATALGASTLAFVDSYMVRTFVKTVILVVALGLLHGLLFLPVALSAFVPADQYLETNNYARVRAYVTQTLPRRRLAAYFSRPPEQPPRDRPISDRPKVEEVSTRACSSLAWSSASSSGLLTDSARSPTPVYDIPPINGDGPSEICPESLSGQLVQITLKNTTTSGDRKGESGTLKTFQTAKSESK